MKKNRLFILLDTFSDAELKGMRQYLRMKVSKDTDIDRLYTYCYRCYKSPNLRGLNIQSIKKKVLKSNSDKSVLNALSTLTEYANEYIVYKSVVSNKQERNIRLIKAYNDKGLFDWANKLADKTINELNDSKALSLYPSEALKRIYHEQYFSENPIKNTSGTDLLRSLIRTDHISRVEHSHFYETELRNRGKLKNVNFHKELDLISIYAQAESGISKLLSTLRVFVAKPTYLLYEILWSSLQQLEIANEDHIIHLVTLLHMIKYSIEQLKKGNKLNSPDILQLYQYGIESGILLKQGKMPELRYQNMINSLAAFGSEMELKTFIVQNKNIVNTEQVEENLHLALSQLAFYQKDYAIVIDFLNRISFKNVLQEMRLRIIMSVSYAEISDREIALRYIDNFKRFLKRHKKVISPSSYESNLNLCKFLQKILTTDNTKKVIELFDSFNRISVIGWCNAKIKELKKGLTN